jgi:hypothetical protein
MNNNGDKEEKIEQTPKEETTPPKDLKIAEIWIRDGRTYIEAIEDFWRDKCRALGLLEYCKDIVKEAQLETPRIIPARGSMMNFARRVFKKRR